MDFPFYVQKRSVENFSDVWFKYVWDECSNTVRYEMSSIMSSLWCKIVHIDTCKMDFPFYNEKIVENLARSFKLITHQTPVILTVFPSHQLFQLLKSTVVMLMDMVMLIQIHTNTTSNVLSLNLKYYWYTYILLQLILHSNLIYILYTTS